MLLCAYITKLDTVHEVSMKLHFMFACPVEIFSSYPYKIIVLKQLLFKIKFTLQIQIYS